MDGKGASRIARIGVGGMLVWIGLGRILYPAPHVALLGSLGEAFAQTAPVFAIGFFEALVGILLLTGFAPRPVLWFSRWVALVPIGMIAACPSQTFVGGPVPVLTPTGQGLAAYAALLVVGSMIASPAAARAARLEMGQAEKDAEALFGSERQAA